MSYKEFDSIIDKPSHTSGNETGTVTLNKGTVSSFDDNSKAAKNQRNAQASVLASLPKVKVYSEGFDIRSR